VKIELNELFSIQKKLISNVPLNFKRYLYPQINWDSRMITITGARGTGKTTLVLQHLIAEYGSVEKCLYFSADNPLALKNGIYDTANEYFKFYGDTVIIDEVHKQTNWAMEAKALYDAHPDKKIILLGSSKLNILNQKGDLSRRTLIYNLEGLSFREYLEMNLKTKFPRLNLEEMLTDHLQFSSELQSLSPHILKHFRKYMQIGYYPFFDTMKEEEYQIVLHNLLDKIIYEDVSTLKNIRSTSQMTLKKLIAYLAISKIPTINIGSMCNELDVPKEILYGFFDLLTRSDLINIVKRKSASVRSLKSSRIFLSNPNLYYAISNELWKHNVEIGNLRESFFVSQLKGIYTFYSSQKADYTIELDEKTIEVEIGGRSKTRKQLIEVENGYVFRDDQLDGFANVIPLYLAGFLY